MLKNNNQALDKHASNEVTKIQNMQRMRRNAQMQEDRHTRIAQLHATFGLKYTLTEYALWSHFDSALNGQSEIVRNAFRVALKMRNVVETEWKIEAYAFNYATL